MRQGFFRRAATLVTALAATAGALVATAPTAAADDHLLKCDGDIVFDSMMTRVYVEAARDENGTRICYSVGGTIGAYVVRDAQILLDREPAFDCVTYVPGVVGEPGDPGYVSFRVGLDVAPAGTTRFCVGVGSDAVTLTFGGAQAPTITEYRGFASITGYDECRLWSEHAFVRAGDVEQGAMVPVFFLLFPDPANPAFEQCMKVRTTGFVVCEVGFYQGSVWLPALGESSCELSPEANQRVEDLVALVSGLPGTVVDIADGAVDALLAEVDKVRQHPLVKDLEEEAGELAAMVTTEVDRAVATVLAQVAAAQELVGEVVDQIPVTAGTDLGNCSRNVAALGAVAVLRSADGAAPASVCVVAGTTVVRVTIG